MKKQNLIVLLSLVLIMTLAFSTASFAAAVHIECEDFEQYGGEQVGGANIQDAGHAIIIGSKPDEVGVDCYTSYNLEIAEHGIYTFKIYYSAPESADNLRKGDFAINGVRQVMPIIPTANWETYDTAVITAELLPGTVNIQIFSPADYDNEKVKTCNFDWLEYELTEKIETVAAAPEAASEAPAAELEAVTAAPQVTPTVTAPATADAIVGFAVIAMVAAVIITCAKRRSNV